VTEIVAFLGTKAQYIKTAPVLHKLAEAGIPYRLVDSGQHAGLAAGLRADLGLGPPDVHFGGTRDVISLPRALGWAAGSLGWLARPQRLREEVFGQAARFCIVHGDTPSTLIATLLARRVGLPIVHIEAGLRSRSLLHPFPEEMIRLLVMRRAQVLFAPDAVAEANLAEMRVTGRVVGLPGNTSVDALRAAMAGTRAEAGPGPAILTLHRVENLHRPAVLSGFVDLVERIAASMPSRVVLHGPTERALARRGYLERLEAAGVQLGPLVGHRAFVAALAAAPLVVTDGGSVQEECARLGVPTLLWRARTERPDGLGANVVLSRYDPPTVDAFVEDASRWRRPSTIDDGTSPSATIVEELRRELDRG
jgi:UDP-N-acetylglucosamine 2-epimerase (non-hydrolysing)